jgi:hypothetical protein
MKTASHLRMIVVVATMTAIACTEPDIFNPQPPPPSKGNTHIATQEFHTSVTTWQKGESGLFNGIISQTPVTDLSKARLYWINNGQRVAIETYLDVSKTQPYQQMTDGFIWASVRNNIFIVNYVSKAPNSTPPFPFDVIIVY